MARPIKEYPLFEQVIMKNLKNRLELIKILKERNSNLVKRKKEYNVKKETLKYCKACRKWLPNNLIFWYKDYSVKKEGYVITPCRDCRIKYYRDRQARKRDQKICQTC